MWSLKETKITPEENSTAFTATFVLAADGETDVSLTTRLSSRSELENTIRQNIARLDERSALIADVANKAFELTPLPTPPTETAKETAQREYDEAVALYEDLKIKAELDPTTFTWSLDNQKVIVQQKLQVLMSV